MDQNKYITHRIYWRIFLAMLLIFQTILYIKYYDMARDIIFIDREKFSLTITAIIFVLLPFAQLFVLIKLIKQFKRKYIIAFVMIHSSNYLWLFALLTFGYMSVNVC